MNPEHQRTNPQRAVDEYKNNTPPLVQLGQGREEPEDELIRSLTVLLLVFIGIGALMFACYLIGGWQ